MWRVEDSRKNMKKSARTAKEHDTDTVDTGSYTTIAYHLHVVLLCRQSWASRLLAALDFSSVLAANTTCQGHNEHNEQWTTAERKLWSWVEIQFNFFVHSANPNYTLCTLPTSTRRFVQTMGDIGWQKTDPLHGPHRRWCGSWSSCLTYPNMTSKYMDDNMVTHQLTLRY